MTQGNNLTLRPIHTGTLRKNIFVGYGIGLVVISFFILSAHNPVPADWGTFWMIKPLVITPLAGAAGGAYYYFARHFLYQDGWKKPLGIFLAVIGFIIAVWMGIVLGLNGTMWN